MSQPKTRGAMLACGVALVLLVAPSRSEACESLDWLWPWNWCRGPASATTFAPAYAAPAVSSAPSVSCPAPTCSYVPQTAYRTVLRTVPVTTCCPVTYRDPCSGCPVTCYRPVTNFVRTTQLVPYTTYRRVWSNPCVPTCGVSCGTTYAPASTVSGGCTSCGVPSTTPSSYLGSSTTITPTPSTPSGVAPAIGATPPNGTGGPKTFEQRKPVIESPMKPIPDKEIQVPNKEIQQNSLKRPQLIDPVNRTTARPVQQAGYFHQASYQTEPARKPVDYGGWRASRD